MKQNEHALMEHAESWGTRLLFAGGTVSSMMCPVDGQQKDYDKKARRNTSQDEGRDKAEKNKSRSQRGGGFSLKLYLPGVSRWSGVI